MKPLSFLSVAIATVSLILCSAFSTGKRASPRHTSDSSVAAKFSAHYYYYLASDDSYDAYNTIADEIARQENITGAYVSTSSFGGSLLVSGYTDNEEPHDVWPSSLLYVHY